MVNYVEWFRIFIENHHALQYIIIFVGTTVGGELALFTLGFLIAQSVVPLVPSLILGFIGSFIPNVIWFYLGSSRITSKIVTHKRSNTTFEIVAQAVERISKGNHFLAIIIIKFLVGTPALLMIYVHKNRIKWRRFINYQAVAMFLSMLIIVPTGYISGRGFTYLSTIFHNFYVAFGFILFVLFAVTVLQVWLEKRIEHVVE